MIEPARLSLNLLDLVQLGDIVPYYNSAK
jgi:hypothetical protein